MSLELSTKNIFFLRTVICRTKLLTRRHRQLHNHPLLEVRLLRSNHNYNTVLTSTLVFPGTGTGALSKRKIHVSISRTSCMTRLGVLLSITKPVSTPQTVSLLIYLSYLINNNISIILNQRTLNIHYFNSGQYLCCLEK